MTALLSPPSGHQLWSSMPGWGIVADLRPPELIAARHLRVLRKFIILGLSLTLVLCAAGYVLARQRHVAAAGRLDDANLRTTQVRKQSNSYAGITRIQGTVAAVQGQVASLMKDDVDLAALLAKIRSSLPASMSISTLNMTLTATGSGPAAGAVPGLDTSGHQIIGTVTVGGSGRTLDDLPAYVDRLAGVTGVVNLVPTSNQASKGGAEFSLSFAVTDELYSHRYDASTVGSK